MNDRVADQLFRNEYALIQKEEQHSRYFEISRRGFSLLVGAVLLFIILLLPQDQSLSSNLPNAIIPTFFIIITILQMLVVAQTLKRSWRAIDRHQSSQQHWESLVLAGVRARSLVLGKWRAVVAASWSDFAVLAVIRSLLFITGIRLAIMRADFRSALLIFIFFGVIALLQLSFLALCGILAASGKSYGRVFQLIPLWLMVVLVTGIFFLVVTFLYSRYALYLYQSGIDQRLYFSATYSRVIGLNVLGVVAIVDGGMITFYLLMGFGSQTSEVFSTSTVLFLIVVIHFFWIFVAMWVSTASLKRRGVL